MLASKHDRRNIVIIDCRYEYEFSGGHIATAHNMSSPSQIYHEFFSSEDKIETHMRKNSIIVLHCEFSTHRGPQTYNLIRKTDRKINEQRYPQLCYPELYLLEHGYKEFYHEYPVSILSIIFTYHVNYT